MKKKMVLFLKLIFLTLNLSFLHTVHICLFQEAFYLNFLFIKRKEQSWPVMNSEQALLGRCCGCALLEYILTSIQHIHQSGVSILRNNISVVITSIQHGSQNTRCSSGHFLPQEHCLRAFA